MKKLFYIAALLMAFFWYGCSKEGRLDFIDPNAPAPAQVSAIKIVPAPGGAILTYKLPDDPNLGYVKAVYEIQPGVFREAKASRYKDTLRLEGFGDTLSHAVKIYSVGNNEKLSESVSIDFIPLTPPVITVFKTSVFTSSFGGVNIAFKNPGRANLSIIVLRDSTGHNSWTPVMTFYTKAIAGNFSTRGLDSIPQRFAVLIRDRWNNKSDTLIKMLTPKFELAIPKNTWSPLVLPTDQTALAEPGFRISNMWNGGIYASSNASSLPQWFTIDFGVKVLMSRFKMFTERNDHCYTGSAVKIFELWGTNSPDSDGGWTQWQLLGSFHSFKPSGLPLGQRTLEDQDYANFLGEDFNFATPPPPVRYIRWKTLETYASPGQVVIDELSFWGQIVK